MFPYFTTGCSLNIVFFSKILKYIPDSGLSRFPLGVSVCAQWQVKPQRLQQNWHSSEKSQHLRKTQYLMNTLYKWKHCEFLIETIQDICPNNPFFSYWCPIPWNIRPRQSSVISSWEKQWESHSQGSRWRMHQNIRRVGTSSFSLAPFRRRSLSLPPRPFAYFIIHPEYHPLPPPTSSFLLLLPQSPLTSTCCVSLNSSSCETASVYAGGGDNGLSGGNG